MFDAHLLENQQTIQEAISASGDIVSFNSSIARPISDLIVNIEPVQSGSGDPYPAGGGKNILETVPFDTFTMNGITFTYNNDGSITVNGTATGRAYRYFRIYSSGWLELNETYTVTLSGLPNTAQSSFLNFTYSDNGTTYGGSYGTLTGNHSRQIVFDHEYNSVLFDIPSGQSFSNNRICVQIEKGTTSTAWTPYSNIRPISGWTGCEVTRTGKNLTGWIPGTQRTSAGVQYTVNADGSISCVGTASGATWGPGDSEHISLKPGTYVATIRGNTNIRFFVVNDSVTPSQPINLNAGVFTLTQDTLVHIYIAGSQGVTFNETVYIQLELGSTATAYKPYTGVDTLSVTFPTEAGTVYGGTLDVVRGKLRATHRYFDLTIMDFYPQASGGYINARCGRGSADLEATGNSMLSNCLAQSTVSTFADRPVYSYRYVSGNYYPAEIKLPSEYDTDAKIKAFFADVDGNGTHGVLLMKYATPIEYDLDPVTIQTLLGQNNVWADTGDIASLKVDAVTGKLKFKLKQ